jgi:cellulose synthase/poly-beta-1,6-N-acetylglucosamine synthase-like glycosyltransferase
MRAFGERHAVFWGSTGVLAYMYVGFPLVVAVRGLLRQRHVASGGEPPPVTVVIPAFNESGIILEKLENTLSLDYPPDRVEVVVASDG